MEGALECVARVRAATDGGDQAASNLKGTAPLVVPNIDEALLRAQIVRAFAFSRLPATRNMYVRADNENAVESQIVWWFVPDLSSND